MVHSQKTSAYAEYIPQNSLNITLIGVVPSTSVVSHLNHALTEQFDCQPYPLWEEAAILSTTDLSNANLDGTNIEDPVSVAFQEILNDQIKNVSIQHW